MKYREVKRAAKAGEQIKIVHATEPFGYYKDGDVLTVANVYCRPVIAGAVVCNGCGIYINLKEYVVLELIAEPKIVITTNAAEVLARLYDGSTVAKSATAHCSPSDTFSFETGAKLAFDRLMGKDEPKQEKPAEDYSTWVVVKREPKVGDKVRLITDGGYGFSKKGDICTVIGNGKSSRTVNLSNPKYATPVREGGNWDFRHEEFEILEPRPAFKVGDRVREKRNGKIRTVKMIRADNFYRFNDDDGIWVPSDILEPAPERMVRVFSLDKFLANCFAPDSHLSKTTKDALSAGWPQECNMREVKNGGVVGTSCVSDEAWEIEVPESEVRK